MCSSNSDLYGAFIGADQRAPRVIAHLGQSIDGFVATRSGDSYYVTGSENLDHLHRMRALADAVVVGAGTVEADDPALTTRRVSGPNPVRVILDGRCRLHDDFQVFADDAAPTLLVCGREHATSAKHGNAEVLALPSQSGCFGIVELVMALNERGLSRIFVEGGGTVVTNFLNAGVLHRLQITVAPVMIGAGRRGVVAPAQQKLRDCLRPRHQIYRMGDDVMFDYDMRSSVQSPAGSASRSR